MTGPHTQGTGGPAEAPAEPGAPRARTPRPPVGLPLLGPYLWVFAGLAVCVALLSLRLVTSGDPFAHLAVGRWIAEHRAVPRQDLFLYTSAHHPWVAHHWLFQLALYGVYRVAGMAGVQVMVLLAALAVVAILLHLWRRMGVHPALAPLPFLLALVLMAERFRARPELATSVLLAATLSLLFQWRARPGRAIWALPAIGALWANLHGGMVSGLLLCGVFTACEGLRVLAAGRLGPALPPARWASLALATAAMAAAPLLNPYGLRWYEAVTPGRIGFLRDYIVEWQPLIGPDGHVAASLPVLLGLLALALASFIAARRFDPTALVVAVVFAALALQAQRNLALLGPALLAVMAANLGGTEWLGRRRWAVPACAAAGGLVGLAVIALALNMAPFSRMARMRRLGLGVDAAVVPVAATEWVRWNRLPGRLFNEYRYGGYLAWASRGGRPAFIDGLNAYEADLFKQYVEIRRAKPQAKALLDRWEVNTCLLPHPQVTPPRPVGDLRLLLADSPQEWALAYQDATAVVFVRLNPVGDADRPALQ